MPTKAKPKKKKITLDDFAVAIQRDLARMATKQDLAGLHRDVGELLENMVTKLDLKQIHGRLSELSQDVKTVTEVMVSKADLETLREELLREIRDGKHIDELRERLAIVEGKLGIPKTRRAA